MKKLLWIPLLLLGISALYSCQENLEPNEPAIEPAPLTDEFIAHRELICALGYEVDQMRDEGAFYVVEGDIAFDKQMLKELAADTTATRHTYYSDNSKVSIPNNGKRRIIKVYSTGSLGTIAKNSGADCTEKSWEDAFKDAIKEWNAIPGFGIELQWEASQGELEVYGNPRIVNGFAYAYPPDRNGDPGKIQLNTDYTGSYGKLSFKRQVQGAVHLLGHALGFSHTNPGSSTQQEHLDEQSSSFPKLVPGTHDDSNSVMEMKSVLKEFSGLTAGDKTAFAALYPLGQELPEIPSSVDAVLTYTGSQVILQGNSMTFSLSCNTSGYSLSNVVWSGGTIVSHSSSGATIRFDTPGKQTVTVSGTLTGTGYNPRSFGSKTATIYVISTEKPRINATDADIYALDDSYEFTAEYAVALPNVTYVWTVDNGIITDQQDNKAYILFNTSGTRKVTCQVIQKSTSGAEYSSPAGEASVTVKPSRTALPNEEPRFLGTALEVFDKGFLGISWEWSKIQSENYNFEWDYSQLRAASWIVDNKTSLDFKPHTAGRYTVTVRITGKYNGYDSGILSAVVNVKPTTFDKNSNFYVDIRYDQQERKFKDIYNMESYDEISIEKENITYDASTGDYYMNLAKDLGYFRVRHNRGISVISEDQLGDIEWDMNTYLYISSSAGQTVQENILFTFTDSYGRNCEIILIWDKNTKKGYLKYLAYPNRDWEGQETIQEFTTSESVSPYDRKINVGLTQLWGNRGMNFSIGGYQKHVLFMESVFPYEVSISGDGGVSRIYSFSLKKYD